MFSLDNVLDDLWPQAKPTPWQKHLLRKLFYEQEFQQFAANHTHLRGLDMVEQVLEHLQIRCEIAPRELENIPEQGPVVIHRQPPHRHAGWTCTPVRSFSGAPRCESRD